MQIIANDILYSDMILTKEQKDYIDLFSPPKSRYTKSYLQIPTGGFSVPWKNTFSTSEGKYIIHYKLKERGRLASMCLKCRENTTLGLFVLFIKLFYTQFSDLVRRASVRKNAFTKAS